MWVVVVGVGEETDDISDYKTFTFLDIHIHCI